MMRNRETAAAASPNARTYRSSRQEERLGGVALREMVRRVGAATRRAQQADERRSEPARRRFVEAAWRAPAELDQPLVETAANRSLARAAAESPFDVPIARFASRPSTAARHLLRAEADGVLDRAVPGGCSSSNRLSGPIGGGRRRDRGSAEASFASRARLANLRAMPTAALFAHGPMVLLAVIHLGK